MKSHQVIGILGSVYLVAGCAGTPDECSSTGAESAVRDDPAGCSLLTEAECKKDEECMPTMGARINTSKRCAKAKEFIECHRGIAKSLKPGASTRITEPDAIWVDLAGGK